MALFSFVCVVKRLKPNPTKLKIMMKTILSALLYAGAVFLLGVPYTQAQRTVYTFKKSVTYMDNSGSIPEGATLLLGGSKDDGYIGMEAEGVMTILDTQSDKIITFPGGDMAMTMSMSTIREMAKSFMPNEESADKLQESNEDDVKIEATGKSGTHLGYKYEEFKITSNKGDGLLWLSDSPDLNIFDYFKELMELSDNQTNSQAKLFIGSISGKSLIKADIKQKDSNEAFQIELKEVKDIDQTIDLGKYTVTDMDQMMRGFEMPSGN